jgi:hypothetical protein
MNDISSPSNKYIENKNNYHVLKNYMIGGKNQRSRSTESASGSKEGHIKRYPIDLSYNPQDLYSTQIILHVPDHIIQGIWKTQRAYTIRETEYDCTNLRKIVKEIESKATEHPWSNNKVFDIIHPSHYPFIDGISLGQDGKKFKDPYKAHEKDRRPGYYIEMSEYGSNYDDYGDGIKMKQSKLKWLPTEYIVKKKDKMNIIEQLSYINDLFDLPENTIKELELEILKLLSNSIELFEALVNDMSRSARVISDRLKVTSGQLEVTSGQSDVTRNDNKIKLYENNLQVIIKIAQYDLKAGESHEGIWHVEGMPDEHIIMTSTCYFEDDFDDCVLEFRRDRTLEEQENLMMVPEQNAKVLGEYATTYQHLGRLNTKKNFMYAWTNACQHRLMKITNNSKKTKRRSFIAFFLVDPAIRIVSTADILPQNTSISKKESQKYMVRIMEERKTIKDELNSNSGKEISYCEH